MNSVYEFLPPDFFKGLTDEEPMPDIADPLQKFLEDAELAGTFKRAGFQHVENLNAETSQLDARIANAYKKIANQAAAQTLSKSAATTEIAANDPRVARVEKTTKGGTVVVALLDADNHVLRTFIEGKD
jgi:hypothetical protein